MPLFTHVCHTIGTTYGKRKRSSPARTRESPGFCRKIPLRTAKRQMAPESEGRRGLLRNLPNLYIYLICPGGARNPGGTPNIQDACVSEFRRRGFFLPEKFPPGGA